MSGYAHPDVLVSADWVADHLGDPAVRLVDIDFDAAGGPLIPGAIRWRWRKDGLVPLYRHRGIVDRAACEALLSRSGIAEDTTVVICGNPLLTGFAYWLLKTCGHEDVRLLDGGRQGWVADGRPTTARVGTVSRAARKVSLVPGPDSPPDAVRALIRALWPAGRRGSRLARRRP
jgi:thiosulfate/3-mercaptopyruvate sulfurtransferase